MALLNNPLALVPSIVRIAGVVICLERLLHRYFVVENLGAFHQAALVWGEGEAAVHGRAVVEEDEVAVTIRSRLATHGSR